MVFLKEKVVITSIHLFFRCPIHLGWKHLGMGQDWVPKNYPPVNVNKKTDGKDPPCFMGKSTISTGPFSIANC